MVQFKIVNCDNGKVCVYEHREGQRVLMPGKVK